MDCSSDKRFKKKLKGGLSINHGCEGGSTKTALEYVLRFPLASELVYQYKGKDGKCNQLPRKQKNNKKLTAYANKLTTTHAIQSYLRFSPCVAEISASSPIFKFYHQGIIDDHLEIGESKMICSKGEINHAVLIVGWGFDEFN